MVFFCGRNNGKFGICWRERWLGVVLELICFPFRVVRNAWALCYNRRNVYSKSKNCMELKLFSCWGKCVGVCYFILLNSISVQFKGWIILWRGELLMWFRTIGLLGEKYVNWSEYNYLLTLCLGANGKLRSLSESKLSGLTCHPPGRSPQSII